MHYELSCNYHSTVATRRSEFNTCLQDSFLFAQRGEHSHRATLAHKTAAPFRAIETIFATAVSLLLCLFPLPQKMFVLSRATAQPRIPRLSYDQTKRK